MAGLGHPRFSRRYAAKTWMPGTRPGMTTSILLAALMAKGSGRGVVEHAAAGLFIAGHQRVFRQDLTPIRIAGFRQRDRNHVASVQIGYRPLVHFQNQHVARSLEAVR